MRLIWQSKIESGSTLWPDVDLSQLAKCTLASRIDLRNSSQVLESPANALRSLIRLKSVIQPSPITFVMAPDSAGLASSSQRRGVTPFVLLLKRSGNTSARSFTVVVRNSFEWTAATPLVLCEPTIARLA